MREPNDHQDATLLLSAREQQRGEDLDALRSFYRMYTNYAERAGLRCRAYTIDRDVVDDVRRIVISIEGAYAYGQLRGEVGLHRLIHNGASGFVRVQVAPDPTDTTLPDEEIELAMVRTGGRSCFGRDTLNAVRATHQPTQTTVYCQDERSQYRNRQDALRALAILVREESETRVLRSYHLAPDSWVRDHILGLECSDAQAALNGVLDAFIRGHIKQPLKIFRQG